MSTRRVKYYEMKHVKNSKGLLRYQKVEGGEADFHQFGVSYEELEAGPGNFTTAILELDDGQVLAVDAEYIKFIDKENKE